MKHHVVSEKKLIFVFTMQIILAVGMKLQAIIAGMAMEIKDKQTVVHGMPLVHLSDQHFWFGRPQLVLSLIRLALFLVTMLFLLMF